MVLLLNTDGNPTNGWAGYDYMLNRVITTGTNGLRGRVERSLGGWNWQAVGEADLVTQSNQLHLAVPRSLLGLPVTNGLMTLDFKWADNLSNSGDPMEFMDRGDVAPNNRFNYRYQELVAAQANYPPVLAPISNQTVLATTTLLVTNSVTDPDLPPQTLIFSLLSAPTNATINPASGLITWTPLIAQSPWTTQIQVKVEDDGSPSLSATQSFWVTVNRPATPALRSPALGRGTISVRGERRFGHLVHHLVVLKPPGLVPNWPHETGQHPVHVHRSLSTGQRATLLQGPHRAVNGQRKPCRHSDAPSDPPAPSPPKPRAWNPVPGRMIFPTAGVTATTGDSWPSGRMSSSSQRRTMPSTSARSDFGRSAAGTKTRSAVGGDDLREVHRHGPRGGVLQLARPSSSRPPRAPAPCRFRWSGMMARSSPMIFTPFSRTFLPRGNSMAHQTSSGLSLVPPP